MAITYWGNPRNDGTGGKIFDAPVQIDARWQDRVEESFDDKGAKFISRAKVFLNQDVDIGGYLYKGVSLFADPTSVEGAWPIKQFSKISNMGRTKTERKAIL
jgi:hypothetical protein